MLSNTIHRKRPMCHRIVLQISNILLTKRNHYIIYFYIFNRVSHAKILFLPNISFTPANVITNDATNKSAIAKDAKNKFPILRKLRSV